MSGIDFSREKVLVFKACFRNSLDFKPPVWYFLVLLAKCSFGSASAFSDFH